MSSCWNNALSLHGKDNDFTRGTVGTKGTLTNLVSLFQIEVSWPLLYVFRPKWLGVDLDSFHNYIYFL